MEVSEIAKALYTVNRHAKAALEPQHLYEIKKKTIEKLLEDRQAKKIGLHFTRSPKLSSQHSMLLVKVADYYFHIPPSREDFQKLEHLGHLDEDFRNKRARMSLSEAKRILYKYLDWKFKRKPLQMDTQSNYYTPSFLGQWPPKNNNKY